MICNGEMLEDKTLKKLGLVSSLTTSYFARIGKIIARGLKQSELIQ